MAKRTKEEMAAATERCQNILLSNIRDGIRKVKDMVVPTDVSALDLRNTADKLSEQGVLIKVGKRNATFTLVEGMELPEATPEEPLDTEGMTDLEQKFHRMIRSMPQGKVGWVQAELPHDIVRRFADKHNASHREVDKLLSNAVREGILSYETRYSDGYRIFVWRT